MIYTSKLKHSTKCERFPADHDKEADTKYTGLTIMKYEKHALFREKLKPRVTTLLWMTHLVASLYILLLH